MLKRKMLITRRNNSVITLKIKIINLFVTRHRTMHSLYKLNIHKIMKHIYNTFKNEQYTKE